MSSATSTEPQPLQPWQFFTLAGLVGATIVVFLSEGQSPAGIILLSLIVFGAAAVGVAAWRTFAPLSAREEPAGPQVFGGRTRAALWREKTLVLRSIKDLEFDHAMGKLSDKDFAEMGARLRARATGLMRQLDAGSSYRDAIQREIDKRIGGPDKARPTTEQPTTNVGRAMSGPPEPSARTLSPLDSARGDRELVERSGPPAVAPPKAVMVLVCGSCSTQNDPDAKFCKSCGSKLA